MTNENELNDLRARIGKLNARDQIRLLEFVLEDNNRRWEEVRPSNLAADREMLNAEARAEIAALEGWSRQQAAGRAEETKRAAG